MISQLEDIGDHYATTLRRWRQGFFSQIPAVRAMGFDDRFIRMWEYYLAASEAGFLTRNTGDLQIVFDKPGLASLPPRALGEQHRLPVTAAGADA